MPKAGALPKEPIIKRRCFNCGRAFRAKLSSTRFFCDEACRSRYIAEVHVPGTELRPRKRPRRKRGSRAAEVRYCVRCGTRLKPGQTRYCRRGCVRAMADPTPEEIRERAAAIRARWSKATRLQRRMLRDVPAPVEIQMVAERDLFPVR